MTRGKFYGKATGQVSTTEYNKRNSLVKKGLASWYKPYRTLKDCIAASGL